MNPTLLTKSGISGLDNVRWGSRFFHFYKTPEDLLRTLLQYFAAGLRSAEICVWLVESPAKAESAIERLEEIIEDVRELVDDGRMMVVPHDDETHDDDWFLHQESEARRRGFTGLRVARTANWSDPEEAHAREPIATAHIIDLWCYPLEGAPPERLLALLADSDSTIACRQGRSDSVEHDALQIARDDVHRLEAAAKKKDQFIAMLGHELRNPLAPILTALDLIAIRGFEDPFEREHGIIERQVRHLASLVDDMLDISRITQGKVVLRRSPQELHDIITRSIELASPLLEERQHRLIVDVPSRGLMLDADAARLAQVFSNLLNNAAKFTAPRGTVAVRAHHSSDGRIEITIADDGRGIPPDRIGSVFEPFEQASVQASDRAEGGIGLGLAIARTLVELHEGTIGVSSVVGEGTEVSVTLPALQPLTDLDSEASEVGDDGHGGARILVVDDNRDAALMLAEYLTAVGYRVAVAHDGPSALEAARSFYPTTALLDIGLPVMDGYELAEHLRDIDGLESVRLIAITGYGQERDRMRSRDAGFHEHMVKPVDLGELLRMLPFPAAAE